MSTRFIFDIFRLQFWEYDWIVHDFEHGWPL